MQDDNLTVTAPPRRRASAGGWLLAMLLAFALGAAIIAFLAWRGDLFDYLPARPGGVSSQTTDDAAAGMSGDTAQGSSAARGRPTSEAVGSLEARLAMLEARFSRIDFEADAASGNAARAEGLLIAFAARRMIERGEPLGFVADQLRLRFADAQPRAVETITQFARTPVTLDELGARLEALTPNLTDNSKNLSFWERSREEVVGLFKVRSDSPTLVAPQARIDRARLMLSARRIRTAIDEVRRLPGAEAANKWIVDAQRFQEAQRALDLLETTAMLEPRKLKDGAGQAVNQPSPLATPSAVPTLEAPTQPSPVPIAAPSAPAPQAQ